ncbi:MAG: ATP-binding cassette domain-containing protein [Treponema sp.]|nr:ATP-binding cassette domain-containing protein [Treponema sp.]
MEEKESLLRVENLRQYFNRGTFRALDGVSFDIKKGEVFSIVGESGCGKTTTGRAIIKLHNITGGQIFFNGKLISVGKLDFEKNIQQAKSDFAAKKISKGECAKIISEQKKIYRQKLGEAKKIKRDELTKMQMIFQDPVTSLDPRMTVREIIAEGLRIRGVRDKKEIEQKVSDVLKRVGLVPEYADRYPHEFSGGQRQRIGIARAIIMEPELIIADEPVSALDVSIKAQVTNLLNDLRHDMGLTVLFISHDLSVVKYFSDRIAVMYFGKIVELATSDELFANPLHPYTKSLLSAIPLPDPDYERSRKRIVYSPSPEDRELPLVEVRSGHWARVRV